VFEAMHFNTQDDELFDAIIRRGEPATREEQSALDRFAAEYERAFKMVSGRRASNSADNV
jgi:hypothetical protein